jgi:outer membrane protein OmpA-like peptidoglycan-associated protein
MTQTARYAAVIAAAVALAGCADRPMNGLGDPARGPDAFSDGLVQLYSVLSQAENAAGDQGDAETYALRAAAAAEGNPTAPDDPALRQPAIRNKYLGELNKERRRLVAALDATGRRKTPAEAAHAQAMYDCWVEQAQEDLQHDHIQACRNAYMAAIGAVEAALADQPDAAADRYLVFFDFDKTDATAPSQQIVKRAAEDALAKPYAKLVTNGHADTSGSARYNAGLSQRRASSVAKALQAMGVAGETIERHAFGETRPLIATGDGVAEPQNRRVEIIIQK